MSMSNVGEWIISYWPWILAVTFVVIGFFLWDARRIRRNAPEPDTKPLPKVGGKEDEALYDGLILGIIAIEPPEVVQEIVEAASRGDHGGGGVRARLDASYTAIVVKGESGWCSKHSAYCQRPKAKTTQEWIAERMEAEGRDCPECGGREGDHNPNCPRRKPEADHWPLPRDDR